MEVINVSGDPKVAEVGVSRFRGDERSALYLIRLTAARPFNRRLRYRELSPDRPHTRIMIAPVGNCWLTL